MDLTEKKGFGVNEIIGIAASIIIAVLIVVPGLRTFAGSLMQQLTAWWQSIAANLFASS